MKVFIAGFDNPFLVSWRYDIGKHDTKITTCTIRALGVKDPEAPGYPNNPDVECYGVAYQNKVDEFNKDTGRKLSLARALNAGGFERNERRQVWIEYFGRGASAF